jgi:hypothetical protein
VLPDADLTTALTAAAGAPALTVVSQDLQPALAGGRGEGEPIDLQTAAIFAFCSRAGVAAAACLAVAGGGGRRLEDEPLEAALLSLAGVAAAVLTA